MKFMSITQVAVVCLYVSASCSSNSTTESAQIQEQIASSSSSKQASKCCTDYPYQLTLAARDLVNSFTKIVARTGVKNCHPIVTSVTSAMSAEYLGNGTRTGMASYGAFYQENSLPNNLQDGNDRFRVTWASAAHNSLGYNYYGVCPPPQITYPDSLGENHVYWAKLIPISQYKAYLKANPGKKDQTYTLEGHPVVDISALVNVYIEAKGGYMATQEKAAYNSPYSSKGVVAVVRLKNNKLLSCYVINNYDSGWLKWKQANNCAGL